MNNKISIAIDGPSGAGKSSMAKAAAKRFGFVYADTGAIYRTVGLAAYRRNIDPSDAEAVKLLLLSHQIELIYDDKNVQHMLLDGEDVSDEIRTPLISEYASKVSAIPDVRAFLLEMQRDIARRHNVVMDGRDIGTVVLPDAGLKIFLTASPEERANRRYIELRKGGDASTFDEVLDAINWRDKNDSSREAAPLTAAADAVFIDTTGRSQQQSAEIVFAIISERFGL